MKPTEQQVREWIAQIKSDSGEAYTQELCELAAAWGAKQAQQTTEPLGFQIRRAIAAEDELRATKQTLEHAYAALQKVADAQAAIEEPELPEAVAWLYTPGPVQNIPDEFIVASAHVAEPVPEGDDTVEPLFTATQMQANYQAGVRAGMARGQTLQALQRGFEKVLADPEKHGLDLG